MVSNSGMICMAVVGDVPPRASPASFSTSATSSMSDTPSHFEMM